MSETPTSPPGGLRRIKSGALSRTMSLAKLTVSAGARAAGHVVSGAFAPADRKAGRAEQLLHAQLGALSRELGELKGSMMKAGQMLSVLGEYFLPPEANRLLKSLQNSSPPMAWEVIRAQLAGELGEARLAELDIDPTPLAAASLGQVHVAHERASGLAIALKVQYPGVFEAIGSDIRALRAMLRLARMLPRGPDYDSLFAEVKEMLEQEADYAKERQLTETFARALGDDPRYVVPRTFPRFCSGRVLATSLQDGVAVDSEAVLSLSQARRDRLGAAALHLYMTELWRLGLVQTDPHFGNYRVQLDPAGHADRLVLLDFGASREVTGPYLQGYRKLVLGAVEQDADGVVAGATELGFLMPEDGQERRQLFIRLCTLICEPFARPGSAEARSELFDAAGNYDWGRSDLPKRVAKLGAQILFNVSLRTPPREAVFLDRKLGGVFIFLATLKVKLRARDILRDYLPLSDAAG